MRESYEDEQVIWTPADNESLKSRDKGSTLFPSKGGFVSLIAEVKDPSSTIVTKGALQEIKEYVDKMADAKAKIDDVDVKWSDICTNVGGVCFAPPSFLSFGYEYTMNNGRLTTAWNLDKFADDQALLDEIKLGKLGQSVVEISTILGGTEPKDITQDLDNGANDFQSAKAAMLGWPYQFGDYKRDQLANVEEALEKEAEKFNENS